MPDKILGLDVGDSSLKAVQVTGGLRGYYVSACAQVEIGQDQGLENVLNALSEKIALDDGACIASIQADRVSFRNFTMPFKDRKRIGQTIDYELEPMLPFSVGTITTDYVVTEDSEKTRILSASVLHETLNQYLDLLSVHNVDPDVVDISGVPAALQLAREDHEQPDILFIDIGSRMTSIILPTKRAVVLVRSFHFGGHSITQAIAKSRNIGFQEAEELKSGKDAEWSADIVRPLVRSFCQEVRNTLHAFRCKMTEEAYPQQVFLTGGGALYPQMATMVQDFLELPVELIDLAQRNDLQMEGDASKDWNPLVMNSALALALRDAKGKDSFNFRIGRFRKKKRYDELREEIKRIAICAGVILLAIVANLSADYYVMQKRHNHLQEEIASIFKKTFPDVERIVDPVHQMNVKISEAKESMLLPAESIVQRTVVDVLRDIALRIPKTAKVDVSSLIIDEERVRLKGNTDTFNTVDAIKSGLEQSSYFKDVSIGSAQLDRTGNSVRFELVMRQK